MYISFIYMFIYRLLNNKIIEIIVSTYRYIIQCFHLYIECISCIYSMNVFFFYLSYFANLYLKKKKINNVFIRCE